MIEIIKPGTKQITKCNACGCEFSFEDEDRQQIMGAIGGARVIVKCPQCSSECELKATK